MGNSHRLLKWEVWNSYFYCCLFLVFALISSDREFKPGVNTRWVLTPSLLSDKGNRNLHIMLWCQLWFWCFLFLSLSLTTQEALLPFWLMCFVTRINHLHHRAILSEWFTTVLPIYKNQLSETANCNFPSIDIKI